MDGMVSAWLLSTLFIYLSVTETLSLKRASDCVCRDEERFLAQLTLTEKRVYSLNCERQMLQLRNLKRFSNLRCLQLNCVANNWVKFKINISYLLNERITKFSCLRCSQAFRHESQIPNWVGLILDKKLQSNARVSPVGMGGFGISL